MSTSDGYSVNHASNERALAKRLFWFGIGAMLLGVTTGIFINAISDVLMIGSTESGQVIRDVLSLAISIVREVSIPVGAALLGSAIVIDALVVAEAPPARRAETHRRDRKSLE